MILTIGLFNLIISWPTFSQKMECKSQRQEILGELWLSYSFRYVLRSGMMFFNLALKSPKFNIVICAKLAKLLEVG